MAELIAQYETEVRIVARARLGAVLRPYLDTVDVVQSVHRSLLIGLRHDKFDISTPDNLLALAVTIVRRKIARDWRRMRRQQRLSGGHGGTGLRQLLVTLSSSLPDAQHDVMLKEAIERVLNELDGLDRSLIELRLNGHNTAEAAAQLGIDAAHARVRLMRARRRLHEAGINGDLI